MAHLPPETDEPLIEKANETLAKAGVSINDLRKNLNHLNVQMNQQCLSSAAAIRLSPRRLPQRLDFNLEGLCCLAPGSEANDDGQTIVAIAFTNFGFQVTLIVVCQQLRIVYKQDESRRGHEMVRRFVDLRRIKHLESLIPANRRGSGGHGFLE